MVRLLFGYSKNIFLLFFYKPFRTLPSPVNAFQWRLEQGNAGSRIGSSEDCEGRKGQEWLNLKALVTG
jgi:hypothetical protein